MHILVTAASKHGATDEVADAIARRIEASGITVDRLAPADVTSVADYDAVVVGSAVYILQWMPEAHDFMERFKDELPAGRVWAFSVGMNGVARLAGVVEGDFRDWEAVDQWADEIVEALKA